MQLNIQNDIIYGVVFCHSFLFFVTHLSVCYITSDLAFEMAGRQGGGFVWRNGTRGVLHLLSIYNPLNYYYLQSILFNRLYIERKVISIYITDHITYHIIYHITDHIAYQKVKANALLEKHFIVERDYIKSLNQQVNQSTQMKCGDNKEVIMLNVRAFKLFCVKACFVFSLLLFLRLNQLIFMNSFSFIISINSL